MVRSAAGPAGGTQSPAPAWRHRAPGLVMASALVLAVGCVNFTPVLTLDFGWGPAPGGTGLLAGEPVRFKAVGPAATDDVRWDFGDGVTGKGEEVFHTYARGGIYIATASNNGFSPYHTIRIGEHFPIAGEAPLAVYSLDGPTEFESHPVVLGPDAGPVRGQFDLTARVPPYVVQVEFLAPDGSLVYGTYGSSTEAYFEIDGPFVEGNYTVRFWAEPTVFAPAFEPTFGGTTYNGTLEVSYFRSA